MDSKKMIDLHKIMIKQGKIPTEIYKYTPVSINLYKTLINAELWFAAPTSFNDPFDCQINDQTNWTDDIIRQYVKYTTQITGEQINAEDIVRANQQTPGSFSKFFTKYFRNILSKQGVTCFSPTPENLLLWAHYADSHKGVCLMFDITENPNLFKLTFEVIYSQDYPTLDYITEKNQLVIKAMLTKSDHWGYEKEIRVLQEKYGLYEFNKNSLKQIIFGCKADPKEIETIRKIVTDGNYPDITIMQVKLLDNSFGIEIIEI